MSKPTQRWPVWKIAVTALCCAAGAVALFWVSLVMARSTSDVPDESASKAVLTLPACVQMLAAAVSILAVLAGGWLAYRLYDDRIPAWQKKKRRKRRRRR
ncbi:MAG: hypothetical protein ACYSVY_14060 [Planctomycetota bacterium]|jgi:peptidoglycan/LPS O-acetylase OafA/YrhL